MKLEKSVGDTATVLNQAYKVESLSQVQVFRSQNSLRGGCETVAEEQSEECKSTLRTEDNVERVKGYQKLNKWSLESDVRSPAAGSFTMTSQRIEQLC